MTAFQVRRVVLADLPALARFERVNRPMFEAFNEPHAPTRYSAAGVAGEHQALLAEASGGRVLTRVVVEPNEAGWLARGSLTLHGSGDKSFALLDYQTDRLHWQRGVASALVKALLGEADVLGIPCVRAEIAVDNTVSLHLLRRAGFQVAGWAEPARLRRGAVNCLELSRLLRPAHSVNLLSPNMHMSA